MQVTKGGCVGQTFALAKSNGSSGGKRSKRRSKEERKGMVETFIKRYQASNNGSFPSLRLTHKKVGGSYYIVREVFRELIQENRVLAPPKLPPGDQNIENLDSFLETHPLGSISFDPNSHPKDNQTLVNEYELRREKVLNSRQISELQKRSLHDVDDDDDDIIISGNTHTTVENEESEDPIYDHATLNSEVEEPKMEGQKEEIEVELNQAQIRSLIEDVVVETFPLRPVSRMVYDVDEKTSEKEVLDGDTELATSNDERFENTSPVEDKASSIANHGSLRSESWETASQISDNQQTNPIMSFTNKFISAFMKFWSK